MSAPAAEPKPTADAPATPPAEPPAPTSRDATKLAQALTKLTATERQALEHKSAAERHAARVAELEAKVAELDTKDLNKLLQRSGITPEQLGQKFLNREIDFTPTPEAPKVELPEDVKREVEWARQQREKVEREEAQRQADEARAADLATVKEALAPLAEKFPLVSALPGAADRLLDAMLMHAEANGGEPPDLEELVKGAETAVAAELKAVASSDAALKALVADEEVKAKLVALLGLQAAPTRDKANPPALTARNTSGVPQTKKGWDPVAAAARLNSLG